MRPLRLGRAGGDRADAQLGERPAHLAERALDPGLLLPSPPAAGLEGAVAVAVDDLREALRGDDREEQHEVARGILLLAEDRARHRARGVVDGAQQAEPRTAALEPVVGAAVELEEHALGRHPWPAAAVPRRPPAPRAGDALGAQDGPHRLAAHEDALPLREQVGEVAVVELAVPLPPQLDDPGPGPGIDAARRGPAAVPVDQPCRALPREGGSQAPQLARREPELLARLGHREGSLEDPRQDPGPSLLGDRHRDRLHLGRLTRSLRS